MKKTILFFALFLNACLSPSNVSGQGWEVLFNDPFTQAFGTNIRTYGIGSDETRMALMNSSLPDKIVNIHYDKDGFVIGRDTLSMPALGYLFYTDNQGSLFISTPTQIIKLNAFYQIEWTHNLPANTTLFGAGEGNNGQLYVFTSENLTYHKTLEIISPDGLLTGTYELPFASSTVFTPIFGQGSEFIYAIPATPGTASPYMYKKVTANQEIVWEKTLANNMSFIDGPAPDGSTLSRTYPGGLSKFDAAGNLEWEKNLSEFLPAGYIPYKTTYFFRQDNSIAILALAKAGSNATTERAWLFSIAPNGSVIWQTEVAYSFNAFTAIKSFTTVEDGGVLACMEFTDPLDYKKKQLIVRTDANGKTLLNEINGSIFFDQNQNCALQSSEPGLSQAVVEAQAGSKVYSSVTDAQGSFSMRTSGGDYTLSVHPYGSYWEQCTTSALTLSSAVADTATQDIGLKANVLCPELKVSIGTSGFRRCFDDNVLAVYFRNVGTAPAVNASVAITFDSLLAYLSSDFPADNVIDSTYYFNLGTLQIGQTGSFHIYFNVDCNAPIGEITCVTAQIYPNPVCPSSSAYISGNYNQCCLPITTSFDPNDKTALVNGRPETQKIAPDAPLEYLIRFQNTGNDTAFNIVLIDTLAATLDAASVIPGASSHPYTFDVNNGHILRFSFHNILLPDSSTNWAGSNGFVRFAIRQSPDLPLFTTIANQAAIYFDYNDPVLTNTSSLVVTPLVSAQTTPVALKAQIWPNPAHADVHIQVPDGAVITHWKLLNAQGQVVNAGQADASSVFIARNDLPAGMYWCVLVLGDGRSEIGVVGFD